MVINVFKVIAIIRTIHLRFAEVYTVCSAAKPYAQGEMDVDNKRFKLRIVASGLSMAIVMLFSLYNGHLQNSGEALQSRVSLGYSSDKQITVHPLDLNDPVPE
ncbi:hypothetical protein BK129_27190 [Paenibacillus amylolyticus]|uniref:hypothetical protein n=1 Tax=Paenibacillus sp. FSL R5-0766 TaxID=2921658 RepID=UPI00064B41FD|nr:hypothetical protein EL84_00705 [Paenibacillus sp. VT-400]OMF00561.1 hypothetical protein BK129_27190 [Paenibacillus amylolyticus]OMF61080.1 hypothetical protein BK141_22305 [Paenibacillus sp. FSL R5-0765]